MLRTMGAVVREGQVELLEPVELPEGADLLVTLLEDNDQFWVQAGQPILDQVWDNDEDAMYAQLLESNV